MAQVDVELKRLADDATKQRLAAERVDVCIGALIKKLDGMRTHGGLEVDHELAEALDELHEARCDPYYFGLTGGYLLRKT